MTRSVEKRGATVEEATEAALVELGLAREDVEIEVLSGGRRGLFGGGRRAHVRVTDRAHTGQRTAGPTSAPTSGIPPTDEDVKEEHPRDQEHDVTETETAADEQRVTPRATQEIADADLTPEERSELLDQEADLAADFVEGLLDLLDLPGDIEIEVQEEQAIINVSDVGSGLLIGRRGATLEALQELVRCATQRQTERRSYVRVDVEGYRARQLDKLRAKCRDAIAEVRETGEPVRLEPMDAYERKMMHDLVAKTGGVTSSSEGSEPKRRVVIHPAD